MSVLPVVPAIFLVVEERQTIFDRTEVSHMGEKQMIETQMLSVACFLLILCIGKCIAELWNKRNRGIRQERNIILTEKEK